MANSNYYINIANGGANTFTPTARRGGTASSGGTSLTIATSEPVPTKLFGAALDGALRAIVNDYTENYGSFPSYYINLADDGAGNKTVTARRGGTASSGGTALTIAPSEPVPTGLIGVAINAAKRAVVNDIASGN